MLSQLSVIIPLASQHEPLSPLVDSIRRQLPDAEIVAAGPPGCEPLALAQGCRFVSASGGRADALNRAGRCAGGRWLWFLHADSQINDSVAPFVDALDSQPNALWYWCLRFSDGPWWMVLNAFGVTLRSRLLGCPFGDQGFAMRATLWRAMGGFPTDVAYGEDHCFVWRARRAGIELRESRGWLGTSARRYLLRGWATTTGRHLRLWARQATSEWRRQ